MTRKKQKKTPGRRMPALRIHKQSQRCYGTFNGQIVWFGARSDPATQERFDAYLAQWLARGRVPERLQCQDLTVKQVVSRFLIHLEEKHDADWHRRNGNRLTLSLKPLLSMHGLEPAQEFSPLRLKGIRHSLIQGGRLCRIEINARTQIIRQVFRWATSEELVPPIVYHGLQAVDPLRVGEFGVREGKPRGPVDRETVWATLPYLHPVAAALVELLWLTGARPSELFNLCPSHIDRSGEVWIAELEHHKTARKGKMRELDFGPQAQAILRRFLDRVPTPPPDQPIFSPSLAMSEVNYLRRVERETPLWDSHQKRYERDRAGRSRIAYADRYTAATLRTAIARAVQRANRDRRAADTNGEQTSRSLLERWTPYQLRHSALTRIRSDRGLEAAKAVGGHATALMTEGYSHTAERELARQTARELG